MLNKITLAKYDMNRSSPLKKFDMWRGFEYLGQDQGYAVYNSFFYKVVFESGAHYPE